MFKKGTIKKGRLEFAQDVLLHHYLFFNTSFATHSTWVDDNDKPVINPKIHTDARIDSYKDEQLLSYHAAVINHCLI